MPHLLLTVSQSDCLLIHIHILNDKQCRSRSVGFFRSQLIWVYTVCKGKVYLGSVGPGWDIQTPYLNPYHTGLKISASPFYYLLRCHKTIGWVFNIVDTDLWSQLIWICTVCHYASPQKMAKLLLYRLKFWANVHLSIHLSVHQCFHHENSHSYYVFVSALQVENHSDILMKLHTNVKHHKTRCRTQEM